MTDLKLMYLKAHILLQRPSVYYTFMVWISQLFSRASAFAKTETAEITKTTKKLCSNCPPFFWYESLSLVFVTSFYIIVAFQIPRSHLLALYENQPLITLKLFT